MITSRPVSFFLLAMVLLCGLMAWVGVPLAEAEPMPMDFDLTIMRDSVERQGQAPYVMKLEITYDRLVTETIGEVKIWWTTPGNRQISFNLRPVEEGFWASRLDPGTEEGLHQLGLVILLKNEDGTVADVYQQSYSLQMPQLILVPESEMMLDSPGSLSNLFDSPIQLDLGEKADAEASGVGTDPTDSLAETPDLARDGPALPSIALLVLMFNVVIALGAGIAYAIYRFMPAVAGGPNIGDLRKELSSSGIVESEEGRDDSDDGPRVVDGQVNELSDHDLNDLENQLNDTGNEATGATQVDDSFREEDEDESALAGVGANEEESIDLSDLKF